MIKVSIIILNYKNNKYTLDCIESLSNQSLKNFEVLVVDNSENDENFSELKSLLLPFKKIIRIKLIRNKVNLFFTSGVNIGVKNSVGEYICLLNNDTIVESDFLEKSINFLDSDEKIGFLSPKINYYELPEIIWHSGCKIKPFSKKLIYHFDKENSNIIQETDYAAGTALFIKKEVLDKIGALDEIFFMYCDELDWNFRAKKYGFKNIYFPQTTVYHRIEIDKSNKDQLYKFYLKLRNIQIFAWKNFTFKNILSFYISHFIFEISTNLLNTIYKRKNRKILIMIRAICMGFLIGMRRKFHKQCKKYIIIEYYFIKKLVNEYFRKV